MVRRGWFAVVVDVSTGNLVVLSVETGVFIGAWQVPVTLVLSLVSGMLSRGNRRRRHSGSELDECDRVNGIK